MASDFSAAQLDQLQDISLTPHLFPSFKLIDDDEFYDRFAEKLEADFDAFMEGRETPEPE